MNFNAAAAEYAVNFIQILKHTKGKWAGKPFILLPWQHEIISNVYGTLEDSGIRSYQYCYIECPKKQGKSELAAGIALFHLVADGEASGEIFSCASDRKQASLVFDVAVNMVAQNPMLSKRCKIIRSQKMIVDTISQSTYQAVSAEAYTKHGISASCVIFDELHAQPSRELWDVMTAGAGDAREQPLWFVITTAGDDPDKKSIGREIHDKAKSIMSGEMIDPRWYCKIWGLPDDFNGDIYDEELWYRVNPSLGHTVTIDKMRQAAIAAHNSPAEEKLFRWLRLNQWVSLKKLGWLPITLWDSTEADWHRDSLKGKRCYVGLDLSTRIDLCDVVPIFPPQPGLNDWRFFLDSFCPEDNIAERSATDHVNYVQWAKEGYLHATPGNVVDYSYIKRHIEYLEKNYQVQYYCGDPWHLEILKQLLPEEIQRKIIEIPQTMSGMSTGMGELERLFRAKEISHDHDPLGRWSFGNVIIATDGNNNQKPVKNKSIERIDPIVALINGVNGAIKLEPKRSVYESRGIRMI